MTVTSTGPHASVDEAVARLFDDPRVAADPYPTYRYLREHAPVYRTRSGHWVLSRYADVDEVLRSPGVGKDVEAFIEGQGIPDWRSHEAFTRMKDHLIWLNPPEHTRLRRLLARVFTPRAVQEFRPQIRRRIDELLDAVESEEIDLLEAFAFPVPVEVIGTLLGVPPADRGAFQRLIRDVTLVVEPAPSPRQVEAADEAAHVMNDYFDGLVRRRRAEPGDDMISALTQAEVGGDRIGAGELMSLVQFLFGAGFETTTNLFGNGLLALLRHPGQMRLLRREPERMEAAIEELLRFDASVQLTMRTAWEDLEVGGKTIPAGESILLLLGAANRDPERFPDPDRLDITRTDVHPLSFGGGIHFCLGAALGRLEGQIGLDALLRRFGDIRLAAEPEWKPNLTLHGLTNLPLRVARALPPRPLVPAIR